MNSRILSNLVERLRGRSLPPSSKLLTDAELLLRFERQRDDAAFELLLRRHGPMVLNLCRRVLGDPHEAEDAFQATFLILARKASSVARAAVLAAWLSRVALRAALRLRSRRRPITPGNLEAILAPAQANALETRENLAILQEEVDRLPEKYRLPVMLCHLEGKTLAEAGELLGCPRGTVAVRLSRARQRLKGSLARRGVSLAVALAAGAVRSPLAAALIQTTVASGRAAVDGVVEVLSPAVLSVTTGVLRTMLHDKLKVAAAVLLATVFLGSGVGWVSQGMGQEEATGTPLAQQRQGSGAAPTQDKRRPATERDPRQALRKALEERLSHSMKEHAEAERNLEVQEEKWLDQRRVEQSQIDEFHAQIAAAETELLRLKERRERTSGLREYADRVGEQRRLVAEARRATVPNSDLVKKVERDLAELEREYAKHQAVEKEEQTKIMHMQEELSAKLGKLRSRLTAAEDRRQLLQRRQQRQQASAERELQILEDLVHRHRQALRDLDIPAVTCEPSEIAQKLDLIMRELSGLRQEVKRLAERRGEE